jgi:(S)-sulfolactate dehydrogenase
MAEIVISEFMDEAAVATLARDYGLLYDPALVERPAELLAAARSARALIVRNRTQVRGELLAAAARLEVIGRLGVGLDNIDMPACAARGIEVVRANLANAVSVAEYVIAGILMLLRAGAYHATPEVLAGKWPRTKLVGHDVNAKTLGLVGFGAIAREVATRAGALGMRVIAHDPFIDDNDAAWKALTVARRATLESLLRESDVVSLHVPLTAETRNLIDRAALASMKAGAVVINAARGGVLDERALADALRAGKLAGAMLDVFATEPLPAGSPLQNARNLILTPHIAGVTEESNARVGKMVAEGVGRVLSRAT